MENMPHVDNTKGPDTESAGHLRNVDFVYGGGIGDDQVTTAEEILANTLPHVEKSDMFGVVDPSAPLSLLPEDEFLDIPPIDGPVESDRAKKNNALLETLLAKEIQAEIAGNPEEKKRIEAQVALLRSRME